ncbi:DUF2382 domain-containing protein [Leptolyngbya sp. CCNP1308]|uniref:DUF2382 domain-containing protein n=1 Tax=Leptolyngbya sp. CCNP1308 TaxID=3110255 RepID=UPI002B21D8E9|nr:DUF2382 domain-containing protein [Leptolyngbya sp. CCNP1308]MEA5451511.1 DUF2382 domain-containing protein [Leptolyngbya sp. CCNP1308]
MSQQHLINSDVFDRSGYLIGNVIEVQSSTATDFSLIVQPLGSNQGSQAHIHSTSITDIDSEKKTIHVDRDQHEFTPNAGQGIQLVEERLIVNRKRVKVGEISVRRVVETEMVEVPIRREKLVVERIGDSADPVEIPLGETQFQGNEIDAQPAGSDRSQDTTASGSFETIQDAIAFLDAVVQQPGHPCEKVRVAILLDGDNGLKGTLYEFENPQTAIQKISRLDKILLNQCNQVRLELFLSNPALRRTYQDWITQYPSSIQDFGDEPRL